MRESERVSVREREREARLNEEKIVNSTVAICHVLLSVVREEIRRVASRLVGKGRGRESQGGCMKGKGEGEGWEEEIEGANV